MNKHKFKRALKVALIALGIGFGINLLVTHAAAPPVKTYYTNGTQTYQFKNQPPAYTWISWNQYITPSNDHYNFFSYWGRPSNFKWRDRYTGDNGTTWTSWSDWMTGSQTPTKTHHEGENNRYYRQIQVYHGTTHKVTLSSWRALIDDKNPSVSYSPSAGGWDNASTTVTVTGSDDASGFKQMRTNLNVNGTYQGWSGYTTSSTKNVTVSAIGRTYIRTEVTDKVGNVTAVNSKTFGIDKIAPSGSISGNPTSWTSGNATLSFTGTDSDSGVNRVRQAGGTWITGATTSRVVSANGTYSFEVEDKAGNVKTISATVSRIDKIVPDDQGANIFHARYQNGNDYWVRPGEGVLIEAQGYDKDSRMRNTNLRLYGDGNDNRAEHLWETTPTAVNEYQTTGGYTEIYGGLENYWSWTTRYHFRVRASTNAGNRTFNVYTYHKDNAGNIANWKDSGLNLQTDATSPTITANTASRAWGNTDVSVALTHADGESGIATREYAWSISTATPSTWTNYSTTATQSGNGTWYLHARAVDNVGHVITQRFGPYHIDKTLPTGSISGNPTAWTNGNATLKLSASDTGGSGYYRTKLPNGTYSTSTAPTYTVSSNGTYSFVVYDHAGNYRTVSTTVSKIDKIAPTGTIGGNPTAWQNTNVTLSIATADTGGSNVKRIQRPDGVWVTGTATTYTATANGAYNFIVEDNAGNTRTVSATVSKIDKTVPGGTVSGNPTVWQNGNATLTFNAVDSGGAGVKQVRIAAGSWVAGSTVSQTASVNNSYGFEVEDHAGNTRIIVTTVTRIDKTKPTGNLTTSRSDAGWQKDPITITATAYDTGSGVKQITRPNGVPTTGSTTTHSVTSSGPHVFKVVDNAGNVTDLTYTSRIDGVLPTGVLSGNPTSWTNANATLVVTASDTGGSGYYRTKLPNGTYSTSTAPSQTISANGTYSFIVYDHAGNARTVTATVNKIDKTTPGGSISGNPTAWQNTNATLTFNATDSGGAGVKQVRIAGGAWVAGSTVSQTATSNGTYNFEVQDHAGNVKTVSATVTRIDKTVPGGTITGNPTIWQNSNVTLTINASDTGGAGVKQVRIAGGAWVAGSTVSQVATVNGTYNFEVQDHAGNVKTVSATVARIDKAIPTGTITGNPTAWQNTNATLSITTADTGGAGVKRIQRPDGVWVTATATTHAVTANGTYNFVVEDHAGNTRTVSATVNKIDKTAPTGVISGNPTAWTKDNVTLILSASDAGGSGYYRTKLPNGTYSTSTAPAYTVSANGTYTYVVYDHAGNSKTVSANVTRIDKTAPGNTLTKTPTSWTNQPVAVTVTGSDAQSGVDTIEQVGQSTLAGRNFLRNSQLDHKTSAMAWNNALNGNLVPTHGFGSGYNSGVSNPTVGYHAHVNTSQFGYPVLRYVNKNSPYGLTNRWMGVAQGFGATSDIGKELKVGQTITVSLDLYSDKVGGTIHGGFYRNRLSTGTNAFVKTDYLKSTKVNGWERLSYTQTVDADWDLTKPFSVYFYGNASDGEATKYVKNVKVELGDTATPHTVAPEDVVLSANKKVFEIAQNGTYTYRISDSVGNVKDTSTTITNIDTLLPNGTITGNPTSWTNSSATLSFTGTDTGGSGVKRVRSAGGTWVTGTTVSQTAATNGDYHFEVEDNAGNTNVVSTTVNRIDKTLPTGSLSGNPTIWTNQTITLTLATSDTGGSGYYRTLLPNGVYSASATPTYTVTANGTYTFKVFDHAGNVRDVSTTVSRIDTTLPTGNVTGNPTVWQNTNVILTLTASDTGGSGYYRTKLPNGAFSTSVTPIFAATVNGTYTFTVYDHAGNARDVSVTVTRIDKTVPSGTISGNPSTWQNSDVTLNLTASDAGGSGYYRTRLPDGNYSTSATPTFTVAVNGIYSFIVYDHAGNSQTVTANVTRIDKALPSGTIAGNPTVWTNQNVALTLAPSDTGGSGYYQTKLPNGTVTSSSAPIYTASSNGTYAFTVYDHAGNTKIVSVTVNKIDKILPGGSISGNPTVWTNKDATLVFNATDAGGSGVKRVRIAGGTWVTGTTVSRLVSANGTYSFEVEDNAGNVKVVSTTVNRIDKAKPTLILTGNPTNWVGTDITLTVKASDTGGSGVKTILMPDGTVATSSESTYTVTTNDTFTFKVIDYAGNESTYTITVSKIDKVKPTGTLVPSTTQWTNQNVVLTLTATDTQSGIKEVVNPDGTKATATPTAFVVTKNGTYNFEVVDHVNNTTTKAITVSNIDKEAPSETTIEIEK